VAGVGEWWEGAVCYQIYPRSFADSNADGIGDLAGITEHLDHLEWLGIDAIWLSPTFPSPNADWGYDVADYFGVHRDLGTSADLDELIAAARMRGIKILLDLVPNHTSIEHPWFVDARSSRDAEHRDWYVWADPAADGGPPNNWVGSFMGKAWTLDDATGQMYLTNFLPEQADLNWWSDEVRDAFDAILRYWFDRGVAGFRIDVAHMIVKDRDLRDNPPASADDPLLAQLRGQRSVFNSNRPEVHDVHRRWRRIADEYDPPRLLVGETFVDRVEEIIPFYGKGDELGLAFNIPFLQAPFDAATLRALVETTESLVPEGCTPVWTGSNHDMSRLPTRWAAGKEAATRCALLMLLTLRGTAFLYYGDEIGMPDTDVPRDRLLDPVSIEFAPVHNRDAARTPMHWRNAPGAGFTAAGVERRGRSMADESPLAATTNGAGVEPWLPFGDFTRCNVADQRADEGSVLHLVRDLIALRRAIPALATGAYESVASDGGLWAWRRGEDVLVAVNLADDPASLDGGSGTIRISTDRARDGEAIDGPLRLDAWHGVVVTT
jgi:alpha-glucosidase